MKPLDWLVGAAIVGILICFALLTRAASAQTLAAHGDSITSGTCEGCVSYVDFANVPPEWTVLNFGIPAASCRWVYDGTLRSFTAHADEYGPGDIVVIECRNVGEPDTDGGYELDFEAALLMDAACNATGADCIWFEQSPFLFDDSGKPWTKQFYDEVEPLLHPDTIIVPNDLIWTRLGWDQWESLYVNRISDTAHLNADGAALLAKTLNRVLLFELCVFEPLYCWDGVE
jgi:hypothetical protein